LEDFRQECRGRWDVTSLSTGFRLRAAGRGAPSQPALERVPLQHAGGANATDSTLPPLRFIEDALHNGGMHLSPASGGRR
jgi:hypothetical protein